MPWRKYEDKAKDGKYGKIYTVAPGIKVRMDQRKKWTVFVEKGVIRKNRTVGAGREGLTEAIKAAEAIAERRPTGLPRKKEPRPEQPSTPSFVEYAAGWYRQGCRRWKPATQTRYEEILRLYISPAACFQKPLDQIGRRDIKEHLLGVSARRSPATVETVHTVISGVFNEAIDDELLRGNPTVKVLDRVLPPQNRRDVKEAAPLTVEERDRLLAAAGRIASTAELMVLKAMVFAGLRLGEALAMRISNLDLAAGTYLVAESYKNHLFQTPKTDKTRVVDLPASWCAELQEYVTGLKRKQLRGARRRDVDLLFLDPKEKSARWPFSQRTVQGLMQRVCKVAGLRPRNPHDLRHTYATTLLMAGVSPAYVQKQLGHHSISMTVDTYGHWVPGETCWDLDAALGSVPKPVAVGGVRNPHIFAYPAQKDEAAQASA